MACRSRAYIRQQRHRAIKRKLRIVKAGLWYVKHDGMLSKGKTHCSCWMCRRKSYDGLSLSDRRKALSMDQNEIEGRVSDEN